MSGMEWPMQQSLVFYMAGMTALSIMAWVIWSLAASRSGAHTRDVASFFKSEYESVFFSRDMLVALFSEDFYGAEVIVKSGKGNHVVAGLRYSSKAVDNATLQFEARSVACVLSSDAMKANRLSVFLEGGRHACEYKFPNKGGGKSTFSVNRDIILETECTRRQLIAEGKYPVLQNGQIVGYIYSESNLLGHYAVVLLLKSELPEPVKALFLALEARRFGFVAGGQLSAS
ncbi:MAG TPA: hypothetical protein VF268_10215 [Gammaproteobacteria bacterium]